MTGFRQRGIFDYYKGKGRQRQRREDDVYSRGLDLRRKSRGEVQQQVSIRRTRQTKHLEGRQRSQNAPVDQDVSGRVLSSSLERGDLVPAYNRDLVVVELVPLFVLLRLGLDRVGRRRRRGLLLDCVTF